VNGLTVGHRFIANYVKHNKVLFRLIVDMSEQNKETIRADICATGNLERIWNPAISFLVLSVLDSAGDLSREARPGDAKQCRRGTASKLAC
jgi:hypothetical protein